MATRKPHPMVRTKILRQLPRYIRHLRRARPRAYRKGSVPQRRSPTSRSRGPALPGSHPERLPSHPGLRLGHPWPPTRRLRPARRWPHGHRCRSKARPRWLLRLRPMLRQQAAPTGLPTHPAALRPVCHVRPWVPWVPYASPIPWRVCCPEPPPETNFRIVLPRDPPTASSDYPRPFAGMTCGMRDPIRCTWCATPKPAHHRLGARATARGMRAGGCIRIGVTSMPPT